ncbi:hypothetical protein I7I53_02381 [Histoplasma capsulatum var. duboisii H88]|uniref:Uncharacterized protein n=1 Tax=Ajellomyces capsulatus (strain H88) TaxID=544711 RepID=A0A8A1LRT6_AJEC8|nr:hypothetical protein I7I53_02381 [Histoplasma capsulatum var. duboisii H88]
MVFPEMGSCERSHESGARVSAVAVCFEEWLSNQARPGQAKVQYNTYTQPHDPPLHAAATSGSALPDLTPWNPSSRWEKINQVRNVLFFLTARLLRSWLALEFTPPFSLSKIIHPSIQPSSYPSIDAPLPGN